MKTADAIRPPSGFPTWFALVLRQPRLHLFLNRESAKLPALAVPGQPRDGSSFLSLIRRRVSVQQEAWSVSRAGVGIPDGGCCRSHACWERKAALLGSELDKSVFLSLQAPA